MIQRVQSIYLLTASILTLCLFCTPFANLLIDGVATSTTVCHLKPAVGNLPSTVMIPLAIIALAAAIICLITIFLYKNRTLQMRICKLNIALQLIIVAGMVAYALGLAKTAGAESMNLKMAMAFPVISIVLQVLAYKGVKKDDDLVRSVDRLR